MSAYSMASMPHSLQPLSRASELPRVHSTKTWLIHCALAIVIGNPSPFCESGTHAWIWISISSYPKRYSFFMPDLLWSGWVCLATPTLPPDASGSFSSDRHAFSATGPAISFFISSSAASCRPTPARSPRMTTSQHLVTHQCMNCDQHHPHHLVRQVLPAENTPEGEAEVLVCPCCGSYDVHQLEAVRDEH